MTVAAADNDAASSTAASSINSKPSEFPGRLYELLTYATANKMGCAGWSEDGTSFFLDNHKEGLLPLIQKYLGRKFTLSM